MTDDLRGKIAEKRIARGRELLERYYAARQRAWGQCALSRPVNRAIETSQQPGVRAKLIGTDHKQSVHAQQMAQIEINPACDALAAWEKDSEEDGRDSVPFARCSPRLTRTRRFAHDPTARVLFARRQRVSQPSRTQLALLKRQGLLDVWADQAILPGQEIDPAIAAELEAADVIVLLVSPDLYRLELLLRDGNDARGRAASRR